MKSSKAKMQDMYWDKKTPNDIKQTIENLLKTETNEIKIDWKYYHEKFKQILNDRNRTNSESETKSISLL